MAKTASKSSKVSPAGARKKEAQKGKKKPGAPKSSDKSDRSKTGKNVVDPLPGDPFEL